MEEVPVPEVQDPEDAVVRVTASSICGSDLHILHGLMPGIEPGTIIGHEFVGVVERVGSSVTAVRPGDRVVGAAAVWCGRCRACRRGLRAACERSAIFGSGTLFGGLSGAQAEYVRVPFAGRCLSPIPRELSDEQVVFAGDIAPTAYSTVAGLSPSVRGVCGGDRVVVLGAGPVGLCAVASARLLGPRQIVVVDLQRYRLEMALQLGADAVVDASGEDVRSVVKTLTDGWGADYVVEAVGRQETLNDAVAIAAPGGVVAVAGIFQKPVSVNAPRITGKNLAVTMGFGDLARIGEIVGLICEGGLDLTPLITHRFALRDALTAYRLFDERAEGVIKIVLKP